MKDADFITDCRLREGAVPLAGTDRASVLTHDDAMRLIRLAEECLRLRETPQAERVGFRGRMIALTEDPDGYTAGIFFDFHAPDDLRALLFADVFIELATPDFAPANEAGAATDPGHGSPRDENHLEQHR